MPNVYAHYFTGMDALDKMPQEIQQRLDPYLPYYIAGQQGPDFFFYYQLLPPRLNFNVTKAASFLHNKNINESFAAALNYIDTTQGENRERLLAYFAGYLGHYALDSTAHSFVLAHCIKASEHTHYETKMDRQLLSLSNTLPQELPHEKMLADRVTAKVVAPLLESMVNSTYPITVSKKQIEKAMASHRRVMRAADDPTGRKRKVLQVLEKPFLRPLASVVILPKEVPHEDLLNLEHKSWVFIGDGKERNESFLDLMEMAKQKLVEYVTVFYQAMDHGNKQMALDTFGDKSFSHGLPWQEQVQKYK